MMQGAIAQVSIFSHELFGEIRIVDQAQEPWWVARDVCQSLGINTSNLSKLLDEDERSTCPVQYTDQVRTVAIINEPGLYSLLLRSRRPEAKAFKRWVTHDVIPSIRKTGQYVHPSSPPTEQHRIESQSTPRVDHAGEQYGFWTVLSYSDSKTCSWICKCVCGAERSLRIHNLIYGNSKSCGCKGRGVRQPLAPTIVNSTAIQAEGIEDLEYQSFNCPEADALERLATAVRERSALESRISAMKKHESECRNKLEMIRKTDDL